MCVRLSREKISSFVGDVLPLELLGVSRDAEVDWSTVGAAAAIRTFTRDGIHSARHAVLVTLVGVGDATITAEYKGVSYTAEVSARAMKHAAPDAELGYYFGDMHDHTSMNHNTEEFATHKDGRIEDYLGFIESEGRLDFGVISDHAGVTNDYDFYRGFTLTRDAPDSDDGVIVFAGAESEITYTELDRLGVLHRLSGEIVTINSAGYSDVKSWNDFYSDMEYSPRAIAIFAHPHVVGFSTNGIWNFNFKRNNTPRMLELMRGIEMGNGEDRKENLLHEYAYSAALDAGFRVSTTCASDSHGPIWGYDVMPGKTVIMATERSREAFLDALISNRFYATESGNVKLSYTVNGKPAPADLDITDSYRFKVSISTFKNIDGTHPEKLEVISDYGKSVLTLDIGARDEIDFTVTSSTARYFYLRLVDREGRKTWSMPVFSGREYDKYAEPDISPIDMTRTTATADGIAAPIVINGDPFDSWCGEKSCATVDIDLGEVREVSAVGYYPHIVLRGKDKGPDWTTSMESAGLVSRYKVLLSTDGIDYTECASGKCQTLGSENIIIFEKRAARYLRFEVLATVGSDSGLDKYKDSPVKIANLAVFAPK